MTPGGIDVVIPTTRPIELMEIAVRLLRERWPSYSAEDGLGNPYSDFYEIPFGQCPELFVYQNEDARAAGCVDPTTVNMIHLLRTKDNLTVVHDPKSKTAESLVAALKATKFPGDL